MLHKENTFEVNEQIEILSREIETIHTHTHTHTHTHPPKQKQANKKNPAGNFKTEKYNT